MVRSLFSKFNIAGIGGGVFPLVANVWIEVKACFPSHTSAEVFSFLNQLTMVISFTWQGYVLG